jgi:SAM-dependent methyltransferase
LSTDPKTIIREGYDRASYAHRGDEFAFSRSGYAHWLSRITRGLAERSRVLDLGCGCGIPASRELARCHQVTGVDLSPVQIARARRLVPAARFLCADMAAVEFEPGSFDAAIALFSLINLPLGEQPVVIGRVSRWLVPGGRLLAIVGKLASTRIERDFRGVRGATMYWSHADVKTYRTWFEQAGFTIETEGSEPRNGNPGYSVLIGRRVEAAVQSAPDAMARASS